MGAPLCKDVALSAGEVLAEEAPDALPGASVPLLRALRVGAAAVAVPPAAPQPAVALPLRVAPPLPLLLAQPLALPLPPLVVGVGAAAVPQAVLVAEDDAGPLAEPLLET